MGRRPLTAAEAWQSYQIQSELRGGHSIAEALSFLNELEDAAERRALPAAYVPGDHEPRWRTRVNRWFGR
jgi:hypothetical protein